MNNQAGGPLSRAKEASTRLVRTLTRIEANELRAVVLSFLFVFILMAAYQMLKPIRDAMSSDFGDAELSSLWTGTFLFSIPAVMLYGAIIPHVRFDRLVPAVYAVFAAIFVGFYVGESVSPDNLWIDRLFYMWTSVLGLFHLSVFWSFMSGVFNKEQAPRLFATIATGASAGAIVGPLIVTFFADDIGAMNLMLMSALMLLLPAPLVRMLRRLKDSDLGNAGIMADLSEEAKLKRNPFSGFAEVASDKYLLGIAAFILLYVMLNTFFYFEIRDLVRPFERETRAQWWGGIEFVVNSLAAIIAIFGTGRLAARFGMATTLALMPFLLVFGWLLVAASPTLMVLVGIQVLRRAGNYAITRPGREMLYTLVNDEMRYKAKPVIDVAVYRGGDVITAWAYTGITAYFGLGLTGVAVLAAVVAGIWGLAGIYLGRTYNRTAAPDALTPEN